MQIQFKKLHAENAFSYPVLDIEFNNGLCVINGVNIDAGGSNGAGKSATAKIFFYALTGTTPEGLRTDNILSDFHPRNSYTEIEFTILEDLYRIKRFREHSTYENKLILNKNGKDISRKITVDTQKEIYDILQLDREHLIMLTMFSVDTINFAKSTPSERRNLFTELFPNIHKYKEEHAPIFKTERDSIIREIASQQTKIIELNTKIKTEKEYRNKAELNYKDIQEEIKSLKEQRETSTENKAEEEAIDKMNNQMTAITKKFPAKLVDNMDKVSDIINKLNKQMTGKRQERNLLEVENRGRFGDITRLDAKITRNKEDQEDLVGAINTGECDHCGTKFKTAPPKFKDKLDEVTNNLTELTKNHKNLQKVYEDLESKIKTFKVEEEELMKKLNVLYNFQMEVEKLNNYKAELAKTAAPLIKMDTNLLDLEKSVKAYIKQAKEHTEAIKTYEDMKEETALTIGALEKTSNLYDYLFKISSVDIPTYLLNKYILILEETSSNILKDLFPGFRIILSDTATNKKGGEKAELTLGIENQAGITKDYKTLSGGERQAVDISLLFGLQRLVADEKGMTSNVIFLDEILDISADHIRNQSIMELIKTTSKEYDSMFLISHKAILTEEADSIYTVTKRNGLSSLTGPEKYDM